jgi:putative intracellular protease/amidase
MKRTIIPPLVSLATMATLGPIGAAGQAPKVLLYLPEDSSADLEYMLDKEAGVMKSLLEEAGFEVVVASTTGQPFVAGAVTLVPNSKVADVEASEIAGIIMPCMAAATPGPLPPELTAMIQDAATAGKPIAAQFGGIQRLAKTGVLAGKQVSFVAEYVEDDPVFEDAVYSGTHDVVKDGNIITSGSCPYMAREREGELEDGTPELTKALIAALKGGG